MSDKLEPSLLTEARATEEAAVLCDLRSVVKYVTGQRYLLQALVALLLSRGIDAKALVEDLKKREQIVAANEDATTALPIRLMREAVEKYMAPAQAELAAKVHKTGGRA